MHNRTWKKGEDRLAKLFGTTRRPLSGGNSKTGRDDSLHPRLFIESKHTQRSSLWTLYRDTRKKARAEGRIPVIGIHQIHCKGILIVIHSDDLETVMHEHSKALTLTPSAKKKLRRKATKRKKTKRLLSKELRT